MENMKKYVAEFIGTLVLVLFACGTAAVVGCNGADPNAAYLMTALAFGLVIVAMAHSIGNISGCHINPAVSIAMLVSGKMSVKDLWVTLSPSSWALSPAPPFSWAFWAEQSWALARTACLRAVLCVP